jgi:hypothetical protein
MQREKRLSRQPLRDTILVDAPVIPRATVAQNVNSTEAYQE